MNLEQFFSHDAVVPMKKLTDISVEEATSGISLDMSGNPWGEHNFILILYHPGDRCGMSGAVRLDNKESYGAHCAMSFGNSSTSSVGDLLKPSYDWPFQLLLFTGKQWNYECGFAGIGHCQGTLYYCKAQQSLSRLQTVGFGNPGGTFPIMGAGARIEVWGIL